MTDREAWELIGDNIRLIRDSYHWGQVTVEIRDGEIKRVNVTVNAKPRPDSSRDRGIMGDKKT